MIMIIIMIMIMIIKMIIIGLRPLTRYESVAVNFYFSIVFGYGDLC